MAARTWYIDVRPERKETRTYEQLPNDWEVRLTIISTITRHLRNPVDGGDLSRVNFTAGTVSFGRAPVFTGGRVTLDGEEFRGWPPPQRHPK